MDVIFVYITAPTLDEAHRIGRALVENRLAACANLLPGMTSIYRWQGKVEQAGEVVVIAKTTAGLFDRLAARVKEIHSYECPCIVALPLTRGHAPYLDWITAESG
ncbi:divalent-cation tolerance protein CutA [Skermanella mucosa]|uniref:divalent-cation tolerance protein CutA n=1 Tax=Skermanella mucosa TaxID=1789672 RepID=UPI00192A9FC4|nr:divalent-cation tolerance protein CutA [Skermanella mucosa]UEM20122.1 divalent-cation tolerance protein CutA [Skermanella mucosa]